MLPTPIRERAVRPLPAGTEEHLESNPTNDATECKPTTGYAIKTRHAPLSASTSTSLDR